MKTLYIVRHAEPDRSDEYETDFDYPLTKQGVADAKYLATKLKMADISIDMVVASAAQRTSETARLIAEGLSCKNTKTLKELYLAEEEILTEVIRCADDQINSLLIVAHNPGLTFLAGKLADKAIDWLGTCELVALDFSVNSWQQIKHGVVAMQCLPDDL